MLIFLNDPMMTYQSLFTGNVNVVCVPTSTVDGNKQLSGSSVSCSIIVSEWVSIALALGGVITNLNTKLLHAHPKQWNYSYSTETN